MPRFTISHHTGAKEGDHFDLLLEQRDALRTFRLRSAEFHSPQEAVPVADHRKLYLDYEGPISGGRGRVRIAETGTFETDEWTEDRIQVAVFGRRLRTRLRLARGPARQGSAERTWTVADVTQEVRQGAAALLRAPSLDPAPNEALEGVREALSREERRLMSLVDRYTHADAVDWTQAHTDDAIREQLDREKARWQHPWLTQVRDYAARLADLATLLRKNGPAVPQR
jgi:hypothetical protein